MSIDQAESISKHSIYNPKEREFSAKIKVLKNTKNSILNILMAITKVYF